MCLPSLNVFAKFDNYAISIFGASSIPPDNINITIVWGWKTTFPLNSEGLSDPFVIQHSYAK
jgi:hypothetical protein